MDLISREAVLKRQFTVYIENMWHMTEGVKVVETADIEKLPSAFEGMTNGEVIQAVLGIKDEQIVKGEYETVVRLKRDSDSFMSFDSKVWNSPYKGESEE